MKRIFCAGAALVLAGCAPKDETTVVETPTRVIENKTIINPTATPSATPKTIVVKKPVRVDKTVIVENRKNVVVEKVAPTPTPVATPAATKTPVGTKTSVKPKFVPPPPSPGMKTTIGRGAAPSKPTPIAPAPRIAKATPTPAVKPTALSAAPTNSALGVRAEVISTSKVPDPSTVAYSQALVFTKYRIVSVEKGSYTPKEILVAQWGMKDKKLTAAARLRAGDVKTLQLVPLASRPELEKVMRNDDTNEYELEPYFAVREN